MKALLFSTLVLAATAQGVAAQSAVQCTNDADATGLHVQGDIERPRLLDSAAFERLPRRRARVADGEQGTAEYEGVSALDIVAEAGVPVEQLRGRQAATVIIAEARDGYRAAYALAELDSAFSGRLVLVADRKNGAALPPDEGPYRVIMVGESRRSRWIRQVACLRIVRP